MYNEKKEREQRTSRVSEVRKLFERNSDKERKVQTTLTNLNKSKYNDNEVKKKKLDEKEVGRKKTKNFYGGTVNTRDLATYGSKIQNIENVQHLKNINGEIISKIKIVSNAFPYRVAHVQKTTRESLPGEDCPSALPSTRRRGDQSNGGGIGKEKTTGTSEGRGRGEQLTCLSAKKKLGLTRDIFT